MNLPFNIARRYLFAKKSTNAINVITGISVFGIAIGTAALILILSVFNGFEDLINSLFSTFNPDVKVTPISGKFFEMDSSKVASIEKLVGVEYVSSTIEEVAFFDYNNSQAIGKVKGVDSNYRLVTHIDSTIREGVYQLKDKNLEYAVLGFGMRSKLSVSVEDYLATIWVYTAKRKSTTFGEPFERGQVKPAGTFYIQQDVDQEYVLTSLEFARKLLKFDNELSAYEIKLNDKESKQTSITAIQTILGDEFEVKDRYRQNEAFLKLMNMEKWMSFAILSLTLVLVAFNLIGALWMIVLDKKKDIAILQSMGAEKLTIRNIFLNEGLLLSLLGILLGFVIALILYGLQKTVGIVPIPPGFLVDSYPVSMRLPDLIVVAITVAIIGVLASIPPALRAAQVDAIIREE